MGKFRELLSGDDDDGFGRHDRTPLPYREKRELNRQKGHVDGAVELHKKKVDAVTEAKSHELHNIRLFGRDAEDTAREGRIQAALAAETISQWASDIRILSFDFIRDVRDS